MKDKDKNQKQPTKELTRLHQRIAELEAAGRKRNQFEEALRQSEEKYRTIIENIEDGYYEVDLAGNFTFLNDSMCRVQGYPRDELMGMNNRDYMDKETAKKVYKIFNSVLRTGKSATISDWQIIRKDRSRRDVESSVSLIRDVNRNPVGFRGVIRDITERKKAEDRLKESEAKYRSLVENSLEGITQSKGDRLFFANRALLNMTGYETAEEFLHVSLLEHIAPESKDLIQGILKKQQNGEPVPARLSLKIVRKDGDIRSLEASFAETLVEGETWVQGTFRDVTERKKTEETLLLIKKAVESSTDAIGMSDVQGHHFYHNKAFTVLFEYTPEELEAAGGGPAAYADKNVARKVFDTIMSGGAWSGEVEMVSKRGRKFPVLLRADAIKDELGKLIGLVGVHTDITERKKAEEALRESEERFRLAFENANTGVCLVDLEGNLTKVNSKMCEIFGYAKAELEKMTINDIAHPEDMDKSPQFIQKTLRGEMDSATFEKRYIHKKGHVVTCEVSSSLVRNAEGAPLYFISHVHDITDRKRLEEILEKERQDLKLIIDSSPIIVFYKDKEGRFIRVNKIFAEALNMPEEDFVGKTVFDLYSPQIAQGMADDDQEVFQSGRPKLNIIEQYESASGIRWVRTDKIPICDKHGLPIGLIGFAQDITERKRAEEAQRESEQKYRTILESMEEGYYEVDLGGNFTFCNEALCRIHGRTPDQMRGMNNQEYMTPENAKRIYSIFNKVYRTGIAAKVVTNEIIKKDGSIAMVEDSVSLLRNVAGEPIGFYGVTRDRTEQKKAEMALRESEEKYRDLVENINDIIYATDEKGIVTYVSPAIESLSGYTTPEIIGRSFFDFIYEEDISSMKDKFQQDMSGRAEPHEYRMMIKTGDVRWVRTSSRPFFEGDRIVGLRGVLTDIAERKQSEEELKKSQALLVESQQLAHIGSWDMDVKTHEIIWSDEVFRIFCLRTQEFQPTFEEFIKRLHPDDQGMIPGHYRETLETKMFRAFNYRIIRPNGTVRWIHSTGVVYSDSTGNPVRIVGTLQDITDRKLAEEEVKRGYEQLQETLHATVRALASTVEMKDQYTAGHQPRVTKLACAIAEEMGLPAEQIEGIRMSASIHDIGKLMVPAEILNKPGPLTEIQYEMIKMHPRAGYDILKGLKLPWPVAQIILQHHERMDGSGYPQGLSGEQIMLEARILMVANVVEAMNAHRPYRPAYDIKEALAEIAQNRGIFYDSAVVDACLRLFTEKGFTLDSVSIK